MSWLVAMLRRISGALCAYLLSFSQCCCGVISESLYFLGVLSAMVGIVILAILAILGDEWYFLFIVSIGPVLTMFIWVILASKDEAAPIVRDFKLGMNSLKGKIVVFIWILLGSCFMVQWDTQKTILDPLMFAAFSLSWSCALRHMKLHNDNEIQLALLTATSVRAIKLYSLSSFATWIFVLYGLVLATLRIFFESRDVESPPRNDIKN